MVGGKGEENKTLKSGIKFESKFDKFTKSIFQLDESPTETDLTSFAIRDCVG